jgi:hypothetical protein
VPRAACVVLGHFQLQWGLFQVAHAPSVRQVSSPMWRGAQAALIVLWGRIWPPWEQHQVMHASSVN